MIGIPELIDCFGPTPYLYMLAALLIGLGEQFAKDHPRIRIYQAGIATAILIYLTVPRLFFSVPYSLLEGVGVIVHAFAIAGIAFGLVGFFLQGYIIITATSAKFWEWRKARRVARQERIRKRNEENARARNTPNDIRRAARLEEEALKRREKFEEEQRQIAEDRQSKETKKLRAELVINQVLDKRRRESLEDLLGRYLDQDLPHHVYESRLEAINEFTKEPADTSNQPKFSTLAEVEAYFASQIDEIQQMEIEGYEKDSLISTLEMAKGNAVREFMMGY